MIATMIAFTLTTHPFQALVAVIAAYHAGAELLGRTRSRRHRAHAEAPRARIRSAA